MEHLKEFWANASKKTRILVGFAALVVVLMLANAARAQCAPDRDILVDAMRDERGVQRQTMGVSTSGVLFEQWANTEDGSWAITATHPDGVMCIIVHGMAFAENVELPSGEAM